VEQLSWAQLKDTHTGKIDNWSAVGGPDLAIRVVTSHPGSATRAVFQKMVMEGADYADGAKEVASTRRELDAVSKYKGAIGAVSKGFFELGARKTKIVATDAIERPLGLVTVGEPDADIQEMIDFYRSQ
jgi:phosphate transport system substrate-binding protein